MASARRGRRLGYGTLVEMKLLEHFVDRLPGRLWTPGNLRVLPGGELHFCVGPHPRLARTVRTVEWRGQEIARGRREVRLLVQGDRP